MRPQDTVRFFETVRVQEFAGTLNQSQVDGFNYLLDAIPDGWDPRWGAYLLATAVWETAHTMQPVREAFWMPEGWRKGHLSYYPYYGRGYVQLTFQRNYNLMGEVVGKPLGVNPDLALDPATAARIIVYGMEHGSFTGPGLETFFNAQETNWVRARAIINGSDKATVIAEIAKVVYSAIGE